MHFSSFMLHKRQAFSDKVILQFNQKGQMEFPLRDKIR